MDRGQFRLGYVVLLAAYNRLSLFEVAICESVCVELNYFVLKLLDFIRTTIELGSELLRAHKKTLLDDVVLDLKVVLRHAEQTLLTGNLVQTSVGVQPFQVRQKVSEGA